MSKMRSLETQTGGGWMSLNKDVSKKYSANISNIKHSQKSKKALAERLKVWQSACQLDTRRQK